MDWGCPRAGKQINLRQNSLPVRASIIFCLRASRLLKQRNNLNIVIACNFLEMKNWRQRFPKFIVRRPRVRGKSFTRRARAVRARMSKRERKKSRVASASGEVWSCDLHKELSRYGMNTKKIAYRAESSSTRKYVFLRPLCVCYVRA